MSKPEWKEAFQRHGSSMPECERDMAEELRRLLLLRVARREPLPAVD